jgi:hypothetical protein
MQLSCVMLLFRYHGTLFITLKKITVILHTQPYWIFLNIVLTENICFYNIFVSQILNILIYFSGRPINRNNATLNLTHTRTPHILY